MLQSYLDHRMGLLEARSCCIGHGSWAVSILSYRPVAISEVATKQPHTVAALAVVRPGRQECRPANRLRGLQR